MLVMGLLISSVQRCYAKKSSLVSGNRLGENFFIIYPPGLLNVRQNIYFQEDKKQKKLKVTGVSIENLTGYDEIVCEFALCTFNLLDRAVNLSSLFILYESNEAYLCVTREIDILVYHFLFYVCLFVTANLL